MEPAQYSREEHVNACPCKLCVTFDIVFAVQSGEVYLENWRDLPGFLTTQREKSLNWDLPTDHCLICGGTKLNAWALGEHYWLPRRNTKEIDGKFYTSLMLHVGGPMYAVYKSYIKREGGWSRLPPAESKKRFFTWASQLMDLSPEKCFGVASKDHGDWLEIRLGYTELIEENRDQRMERYIRDAQRSDGERPNSSKAISNQGSRVQEVSALAWGLNTILAPVPGRILGTPKESQDSSRTND